MLDLVIFASGVASHWIATMSGAVALSVGVYQYFRRGRLSPPIWTAIGVACLFFACYQTWYDQRKVALDEECKVSLFERRSEVKNELNIIIDRGSALFKTVLVKDQTDALEDWEK